MKCDKKDLLLYAVTDRHWLEGRKLIDEVKESLDGGVNMVGAALDKGAKYEVR